MRRSLYSIADRYRAVALSHEIGVPAAARRFGMWPSTLRYWRRACEEHWVLWPGLPDVTAVRR